MKNPFKLFKNRTFIGVLCIALAAIISFVAIPAIINKATKKVRILRAAADIGKGELITAGSVKLVEVGETGLPDGCMTDSAAVVGKYAATDIRKDDCFFPSKLTGDSMSADSVFRRLNDGKYAMSVSIDSFAAGLSGKLERGDIVRLLIYKNKDVLMPEELTYVKVITATTKTGIDKENVSYDAQSSEKIPSTVTLLVNDIQASMLVDFENCANIHVCLVYRGTDKVADEYLKKQDDFFEEKYMKDMY